jgi:hypothetical protein
MQQPTIIPTQARHRPRRFGAGRDVVGVSLPRRQLVRPGLRIRRNTRQPPQQIPPSSAPDGGGNYKGMLEQMRSELGWRDRAAGERPQVSIGIHPILPVAGRAIWVGFSYADGENPFGGNMWSPNQTPMGKGVIRDTFKLGTRGPGKDVSS